MLWVLIRSASARHFYWVPQYMFLWRIKKNASTILLEGAFSWAKKTASEKLLTTYFNAEHAK